MYFGTSNSDGVHQGDQVQFYSHLFMHHQFNCLTFNYSNYGETGAASLEVVISHGSFSNSSSHTQIFRTETQETSKIWKFEKIGIRESTPFRVRKVLVLFG